MPVPRPTIRRRRLALELRRARELAGLTADQTIERLNDLGGEWTRGKLSRLETARLARLPARDVRDMLDVYGIEDEDKREALTALARQARERGWWTAYGDVLRGAYIGFEAEAASIRVFENVVVPGLLQTEGYAEAIGRAWRPKAQRRNAAAESERWVAARIARQRILDADEPPHLWVIVNEAALLCPVGGAHAMREQLDRVLAIGARERVELQVLPLAVGAHVGMGGEFAILEFADPDDPPLVYLETATDEIFLERDDEVASYEERFGLLQAQALNQEQSAQRIAAIRDGLE